MCKNSLKDNQKRWNCLVIVYAKTKKVLGLIPNGPGKPFSNILVKTFVGFFDELRTVFQQNQRQRQQQQQQQQQQQPQELISNLAYSKSYQNFIELSTSILRTINRL